MAENTFRSFRNRDSAAPGGSDAASFGDASDPLAELARLIGQTGADRDARADTARSAATAYDEPADRQWEDEQRYAAADEPPQTSSGSGRLYDDRYDSPRLPELPPAYRSAPPSYDAEYDPPADDRYAPPEPSFDSFSRSPLDPGSSAEDSRRYRDEQPAQNQPSDLPSRLMAAFPPVARADHYEDDDEYDDQPRDAVDGVDGDYADEDAMEDAEEEAETAPRRGRFAFVAAVLGLVVLGTAGAYAYRTMFGSSMIPSLPPIIKADDGPNKILPNSAGAKPAGTSQAGNAGAAEKIVSREEKPVDVPAPVNPAPRVVSTIPVFPDATPGPPGVMPPAGVPGVAASVPNAQAAMPAPTMPAPLPVPTVAQPGAVAAPVPQGAPAPVGATSEPKKIHTVAIRADQPAPAGAAAAASAAVRTAPAVPRSTPAPVVPQGGGNAPLSIVPMQGDAATPATTPVRTRTAAVRPTTPAPSAEPAPTAGGGYAVQVTSQRTEAEAQAAYRALSAKYPAQLGGHEPLVRRADLGAKGVYYRALVGPFASMEQAASVCSSLKAAGGNCIVQRN